MNHINPVNQIHTPQNTEHTKKTENPATSFTSFMKNALHEVNASQTEAKQLSNQLVTGEVKDIHQVMIASQKANLSLQMTVQVRNKIIESYEKIMRMQV